MNKASADGVTPLAAARAGDHHDIALELLQSWHATDPQPPTQQQQQRGAAVAGATTTTAAAGAAAAAIGVTTATAAGTAGTASTAAAAGGDATPDANRRPRLRRARKLLRLLLRPASTGEEDNGAILTLNGDADSSGHDDDDVLSYHPLCDASDSSSPL